MGTVWLAANCSLPREKPDNLNIYLAFLLFKYELLSKLQNRPRRVKPRQLALDMGIE